MDRPRTGPWRQHEVGMHGAEVAAAAGDAATSGPATAGGYATAAGLRWGADPPDPLVVCALRSPQTSRGRSTLGGLLLRTPGGLRMSQRELLCGRLWLTGAVAPFGVILCLLPLLPLRIPTQAVEGQLGSGYPTRWHNQELLETRKR
jgi:hypothetical protein